MIDTGFSVGNFVIYLIGLFINSTFLVHTKDLHRGSLYCDVDMMYFIEGGKGKTEAEACSI